MKRAFALALVLIGAPAYAQKTPAQLTTEINTTLASGQSGGITAAQLRTVLTDMVNAAVTTNGGTLSSGDVVTGATGVGVQDSGLTITTMAVPAQQGAMNVNGDMAIDQLHEAASYTNTNCANNAANPSPLDRWECGFSNFWGATTQQVTDAPTNYAYSLKLTSATGISITATQEEDIRSGIDPTWLQGLGWGGSSAQSVLFDFCAKASQSGTYAAFIQSNGKSVSYLQQYTLTTANTWQCFSNVVAGPTSGTWATTGDTVFYIGFDTGSGSNFQGTAGAWQVANAVTVAGNVELRATTSATLQIAAVHLRPLSVASIPYNPRPFVQELALAQRWVRKSFPPGTAPAQNAGVAGARCLQNPIAAGQPSHYEKFDPPMAASPSIVTYNPSAANANWRDVTAASDVTVSVDPATAKAATGVQIATGATVANLADELCIHYLAVANP